MFYLKLKGMEEGARHCYYSYLEENREGGWFMETEKFKYADFMELYHRKVKEIKEDNKQ